MNGVRLSLEGETVAKQEDIQEDMLARHIRYCSAHGILGVVANDKDKHQLLQKYRRKRGQSYGIDIRTAHDGADADVLRLIYSPNIEEEAGGSLQLNYENLCRILRNRGEKKVIVVANGSQQVAEALEAGCDAIEQGYGMGEANIRMMAAKDVLWIPSAVRAKTLWMLLAVVDRCAVGFPPVM